MAKLLNWLFEGYQYLFVACCVAMVLFWVGLFGLSLVLFVVGLVR